MQIALRGLESSDQHLRGTALEYLDSVLPSEIRNSLWTYLTREPSEHRPTRSENEIVEDLMRTAVSLEITLEDDDPIT